MKLIDLYTFFLVVLGYFGLYNILAPLIIRRFFRLSEYNNFVEYAKNVLHKKVIYRKYKSLKSFTLISIIQGMLSLFVFAILVYLYMLIDSTGYKGIFNISL